MDQNVQGSGQKVAPIQIKNLKNIIKDMQIICDMNKCPKKYVCMDQSSNEGIYKVNVKKDTQCSSKTTNIEVLGIFE